MNVFISLIVLILSLSALSGDCLSKLSKKNTNKDAVSESICAMIENGSDYTQTSSDIQEKTCIKISEEQIESIEGLTSMGDDCKSIIEPQFDFLILNSLKNHTSQEKKMAAMKNKGATTGYCFEANDCDKSSNKLGLNNANTVIALGTAPEIKNMIKPEDKSSRMSEVDFNKISQSGNADDCMTCGKRKIQEKFGITIDTENSTLPDAVLKEINDKIKAGMKEDIFNEYALLLEDELLTGRASPCDNLSEIKKKITSTMPEIYNEHRETIESITSKKDMAIGKCDNKKVITIESFKEINSSESKERSQQLFSLLKFMATTLAEFGRIELEAITGKSSPSIEDLLAFDSEPVNLPPQYKNNYTALKNKLASYSSREFSINQMITDAISETPEIRYLLRGEFNISKEIINEADRIQELLFENYKPSENYFVLSEGTKRSAQKTCDDLEKRFENLGKIEKINFFEKDKSGKVIRNKEANSVYGMHTLAKNKDVDNILSLTIAEYYNEIKGSSVNEKEQLAFVASELCSHPLPTSVEQIRNLPFSNNYTGSLDQTKTSLALILDKKRGGDNKYSQHVEMECKFPEAMKNAKASISSANENWYKKNCDKSGECGQSGAIFQKRIMKSNESYQASTPNTMKGNELRPESTAPQAVSRSFERYTGRNSTTNEFESRQLIRSTPKTASELNRAPISTDKTNDNTQAQRISQMEKELEESKREIKRLSKNNSRVPSKVKGNEAENNLNTAIPNRGLASRVNTTNTYQNALMNKPLSLLQQIARADYDKLSGRQKKSLLANIRGNINKMEEADSLLIELKSSKIEDILKEYENISDIDKAYLKEAIRGGLTLEFKLIGSEIIKVKPESDMYKKLKAQINKESSENTKILDGEVLDKERLFYLEMMKSSQELLGSRD